MASGKRAIPQATRRAVALRAGAIPGERENVAHCHWCGEPGKITWWPLSDGRPGSWVSFRGLELDHVVPEHRGGDGSPDNIVLACQWCNRSRGHRHDWPRVNPYVAA